MARIAEVFFYCFIVQPGVVGVLVGGLGGRLILKYKVHGSAGEAVVSL